MHHIRSHVRPVTVLPAILLAVVAACGDGDALRTDRDATQPLDPFGAGIDVSGDVFVVIPDIAEEDTNGPMKSGAVCTSSKDCAGGMTCNHAYAPAECQPKAPKEGRCGTDADCQDGLACTEALLCKPYVGKGESCTLAPCKEGLRCNHGFSPPKCAALGALGQPCGESADCVSTLSCNRGTTPAKCSPPAGKDSPCWVDEDCADDLLCSHNQEPPACAERGTSGPGEPCVLHEDCKPGLMCDYTDRCYEP